MFRKLGIMWRSFYIKWIKNHRYKDSAAKRKWVVQKEFEWNILNFEIVMKAHLKRKENTIKYYKNGKTYERTM